MNAVSRTWAAGHEYGRRLLRGQGHCAGKEPAELLSVGFRFPQRLNSLGFVELKTRQLSLKTLHYKTSLCA